MNHGPRTRANNERVGIDSPHLGTSRKHAARHHLLGQLGGARLKTGKVC